MCLNCNRRRYAWTCIYGNGTSWAIVDSVAHDAPRPTFQNANHNTPRAPQRDAGDMCNILQMGNFTFLGPRCTRAAAAFTCARVRRMSWTRWTSKFVCKSKMMQGCRGLQYVFCKSKMKTNVCVFLWWWWGGAKRSLDWLMSSYCHTHFLHMQGERCCWGHVEPDSEEILHVLRRQKHVYWEAQQCWNYPHPVIVKPSREQYWNGKLASASFILQWALHSMVNSFP